MTLKLSGLLVTSKSCPYSQSLACRTLLQQKNLSLLLTLSKSVSLAMRNIVILYCYSIYYINNVFIYSYIILIMSSEMKVFVNVCKELVVQSLLGPSKSGFVFKYFVISPNKTYSVKWLCVAVTFGYVFIL